MQDARDARPVIHVVDDDAAIRDSLRLLLETRGYDVCVYTNAAEFLAAGHQPLGCVVSDVRMPGIDGLELQRRLSESVASLPVILMTGQGGIRTAVSGMKAGAVDFLEKPVRDDELFAAIERALAWSRERHVRHAAAAGALAKLALLTPREREVLDLLIAGNSTKAIARALQASPRTIDVHRARVFGKLGAESIPELMRLVTTANNGDAEAERVA